MNTMSIIIGGGSLIYVVLFLAGAGGYLPVKPLSAEDARAVVIAAALFTIAAAICFK